ncbi:ABC transporter transmembrane domain-containing protein [Carboxydochorda subterranea]|uniref:ABC transporter transmembrane domain-containing protein n=1 Tax=Carboxydichorda subterranea TaxID=3109565 RepID=A0ABZ1BWT7_9FIRM|nr:ABC transporter transmembrane domain-containing protein [Limnochorda sp. L945t]WRP17274.1 ABC transporter transmembrane domain-containing protein [Limnochorda sp. L945t]
MVLDLDLRLLEQSLRLDWQAFNRQGSGSFVSRIHKDASEGFVPALNLAITFVQQALAASVFVAVLLYLSWKATLALLLMVPPLMWAAHRVGRRVRQVTSEEREHEARFLHILTGSLKAFRILRAVSHLHPPTLAANRRALGAYLDSTYENLRLLSLQRSRRASGPTWTGCLNRLSKPRLDPAARCAPRTQPGPS